MSSEERESSSPEQPASEEPEESKGYEESGEGFAQADPDVLLDVPKVSVEELSLEVQNLQARVALRTRLSELLEIDVGINISLDTVKLETKGVEAEARLKARLENVQAMLERTLSSVDANPDLIKDLKDMSEASSRGARDGERPTLQTAGNPGGSQSSRSSQDGPGPEATEAAGNKARELGLDLASLEGTGSGGRVTLKDVKRASRGS